MEYNDCVCGVLNHLKIYMNKEEEKLQTVVSNYLKLQFPDVIFTSESSGLRLPIGLAIKVKKLRNPEEGLSDMMIFQPNDSYHGLFLELKVKSPYLKNGNLSKSKHIQDQAEVLERLNDLGYLAMFAWSFEMAKGIIDSYMNNQGL